MAIATGAASGIFVLDVDKEHGGIDSIVEWEGYNDSLPFTLRQHTGGGGYHDFFSCPNGVAPRGRVGFLGGVDVRGEGNYVIASPSLHISGRRYEWGTTFDTEPSAPPMALLRDVGAAPGGASDREPLPDAADVLRGVEEGKRNDTLFGWAVKCRRFYRLPEDVAWPFIKEAGLASGLELAEIERLFRSAYAMPDREGTDYEASGVPVINVAGSLSETVDTARVALIAANDPPRMLRRGTLVRIGSDDEGRPTILPHSHATLRVYLDRVADWVRSSRDGDTIVHPPTAVVGGVLGEPDELAVPVVDRIVTAPILAPDGTLLTEPGYLSGARVFFDPIGDGPAPRVPRNVTEAQLQHAWRSLVELIEEFPFASAADLAHALALLLLPFVRSVIDGPTPLHMIESPTPGTGKSLLAQVVCLPALGYPPPTIAEGRDEDEWRKRITSVLIAGQPVVQLDNVTRPLDSGALSQALTTGVWSDRILGHSKMVEISVRCAWLATGNNPSLSKEIARRTVRIRLDATDARPWKRTGFRHPDLVAWTLANRTRLVEAALTWVVAWVEAGMPEGSRTLGTYERWAKVLGGILELAGGTAFLEEANMDALYETADDETAGVADLIAAWWSTFGERDVTVKELLGVALRCDGLDLGVTDRNTRLGRLLSRLRDTVTDTDAGRLQVTRVPHKRRHTYRLRRLT